jgi:hypothetical protein
MIKNFLLLSMCFIIMSCSTPAKTEEIKNEGVSPSSASVGGVFAPHLKLGEGKFKIISKDQYLKLTVPVEVIKRYETNQKWEEKAAEEDRGFNEIMLLNYRLKLTLLDVNNAPFTEAGSFDHSTTFEMSDALLRGAGQVYVEFYKSYSKSDSLEQKSDYEMLTRNAVKFTVNTTLNFDDSINK